MLPTSVRLPLREEQDIFKNASRKKTKYVVVYYRENNKTSTRFAVVVPKKVATLATKRNYIKRFVEGVIVDWYRESSAFAKDIVVYVHRSFEKEDREQVAKDITSILSKVTKKIREHE